MMVAAMGLSAIAAQSAEFFMIVRWLGAAYLVWMGIGVLRNSRQETTSSEPQKERIVTGYRSAFASGFLTNLLNPKAIVFFLSVLPQFMGPAGNAVRQILILGVLDVAIGIFWWWGVVAAIQQIAGILKKAIGAPVVGSHHRWADDRRWDVTGQKRHELIIALVCAIERNSLLSKAGH